MKRKVWLGCIVGLLTFNTFAQQIKIQDQDHRAVEGAIVSLKQFLSAKEIIRITDVDGKINLSGLHYPVALFVKHIAFKEYSDTILSEATVIITLQKNDIDLKEISITGSAVPRHAEESVYKVDIISREQIEKQAAVNLKDLLSTRLDTRIDYDPQLGSDLSLQGISGQNIKFLVDGVPVIGRMNGTIDISQLNLSNAERVEIINGPMSVLYGTDAIGGVVNIITRKMDEGKIASTINSYYETTGQYNIDAWAGMRFHKNSFSVSGGRYFFDGWSKTDTSRVMDWDPKEQYFGNLRYDHVFNNLKLSYQSSWFHEKVTNRTTPRISPYFAYAFDEKYFTTRFNNMLFAEYAMKKNHFMNITAAYSTYVHQRNIYRKDLVTLDESLVQGASDEDTTKFNTWLLRYQFNKSDQKSKFNYQSGIDFNHDESEGKRIENKKATIGDYAVFASVEYKAVSKITVMPGVRMAYNTQFKAPVIPSLNILTAFNKFSQLRISYSRGFRAPSLKELYLDFHDSNHNIDGNRNLRAENSHYASVSYTYTLLHKKFSYRIEPTLFYNYGNNKIKLAQSISDPNNFSYFNIDQYVVHGAELNNRFTWENIILQAGIAVTGVNQTFDEQVKQPEMVYSTNMNASAEYTFTKTSTTFSLFYKYNGNQPDYQYDGNNLLHFVNESYQFLDFALQQKIFKDKVAVTVGAKNLLDVTSVFEMKSGIHSSSDNENPLAWGRSYFIKMSLNLNK